MSRTQIDSELAPVLVAMTAERDTLRAKLKYSQSAIIELQRQVRELDDLLTEANERLGEREETPGSVPATPSTVHPNSPRVSYASTTSTRTGAGATWIGGTWQAGGTEDATIRSAEAVWQAGSAQRALEMLNPLIVSNNSVPTDHVSACLLVSSILRTATQLERALQYTEKALEAARKHGLHALIGKAQFHRGLCLLHLNRYADAAWCFVLSSHTEGYEELAELNRIMAEKKRDELPAGYPNLALSEGVF